MIELVMAVGDRNGLLEKLLNKPTEECAILLVRQVVRADGVVRLLVRETEFPTDADYTRKGFIEAELHPAFVARVTKRARNTKCGLVFVHSHPGSHPPEFSNVDDAGEVQLASFLSHRHPDLQHAAMVVSAGGVCARRLGKQEYVRVVVLGQSREILFDPQSPPDQVLDVYDRQIRAFGSAGQEALQRLRVAVVGLGGTGSLIAQQLAHLGVQEFILVDPDSLEVTNLNRVVGARPDDTGAAKVDIAARMIHAINSRANVIAICGDVIRAKTAMELTNADLIFGCTDSHGSRSVLQQISYQYLIPCIDMGTVIATDEGKITHISGRAQLLSPGLACFSCGGLLNSEEVRRDMMTAFERQADPYISGVHEPAPAVISINSTVASLAITMFLSTVIGVPGAARQILYNGIKSSLRSVQTTPDPNCYICSKEGSVAQGNEWPLMARQD